jgi:outer membrane protein assembly factor BamA
MCVRSRLLFMPLIALLWSAVAAYSECENEAERSHYTLEEVTFEEGNAFPTAQLRTLIPILSGDVFNVSRIRDGLWAIRELYGEHGYINFTFVPEAQCDENRKSIHLTLILDEGEQFRLGKVLILAPKGTAERLYSAWPVKPGAIYDTRLVHRFFAESRALLPVGWSPAENLAIRLDEKNKTIEVRLNACPADRFCPQSTKEF